MLFNSLLLVTILLPCLSQSCPTHLIAVILTHSRSSHFKKTVRSYQSLPSPPPLYVSLDPNPKLSRIYYALSTFPSLPPPWLNSFNYSAPTARHRIARHYHFALDHAFSNTNATHVLLLEDDLRFSPDFFSYIYASIPYLHPPLVCSSAYTDNHHPPYPLSRNASLTSFFPTLATVFPRFLWDLLHPIWPTKPSASPPLTIGWDFWLRILFNRNNWFCLIPHVPRVLHVGVSGTNVSPAEARSHFSHATLANLSANAVDWPHILSHATNIDDTKRHIQQMILNGIPVGSIAEAIQSSAPVVTLPYLREQYEQHIATPLGLWSTPRGHFLHTLSVPLSNVKILLLYDARRAGRHFKIPFVKLSSPSITTIVARRNVSCDDTCEKEKLICTARALEEANDCHEMERIVDCEGGCAYETGSDLPAKVVVADESGHGLGVCLVTETGLEKGGELDCAGAFERTSRVCGCERPMNKDVKEEL